MHELLLRRNSHFAKAFPGSDTRSVGELLSGNLFAPFHFDVLYAQKAATPANDAKTLSVPYDGARRKVWPLQVRANSLDLAILLSKCRVNSWPWRKRTLQIEYFPGSS